MEFERVTEIIKTPMTLWEFMSTPETTLPMELIDGVLIRYLTPQDEHQRVAGNIAFFFGNNLSGGKLRMGVTAIFLDENVLQPDILWISDTNDRCKLLDGYWHGAPDLIVEVIEPEREFHDRGIKFDLYQQHGVQE